MPGRFGPDSARERRCDGEGRGPKTYSGPLINPSAQIGAAPFLLCVRRILARERLIKQFSYAVLIREAFIDPALLDLPQKAGNARPGSYAAGNDLAALEWKLRNLPTTENRHIPLLEQYSVDSVAKAFAIGQRLWAFEIARLAFGQADQLCPLAAR